ncbi:MAG: AMP-binding protein [Bdellovibrionales bacterium]|nr:AMP-binding protein [Bdellovibrionales bacterium]
MSHSSSSVAWHDKGQVVTYGEFIRDVHGAAESQSESIARSGGCLVLEADNRYDALVSIFAAWRSGHPICLVPSQWPSLWKQKVQSILAGLPLLNLKDLFYILPTSGSTGSPKLVPISRSNWMNFIEGISGEYKWAESTRVALTFHPTFDPFVAIASLALLKGSTLVPLQPIDHFRAVDFCIENRVTVWASTPTLARLSLQRTEPGTVCQSLLESLFTGEVLSSGLVEKWRAIAPNSEIDNLYGPVETTVWLTRHRLDLPRLPNPIPIGKPLRNVHLRIVDGEIVATGPQVSAGYIAESGLVAFDGEYRTGDRGEIRDGVFFFSGRDDQQLKVGGRRVEGSLIENLIENETGIRAVVDLDRDGRLCFILDRSMDPMALQRIIRESLPPWYAPHVVLVSKHFPYFQNGKVDRKTVRKWLLEKNSTELIGLVSGANT